MPSFSVRSLALSSILFFGLAIPAFGMEVKPPTLDVSVKPGGSVESVFVLRNTEVVPETYVFTIQGFTARDEGGRQTFLPVSEATGLSKWLYLNRATVTLKPGESAPVALQFRPPEGAAPGAYQAVVFATHMEGQRADGVTLGSRVGVLVFATVEGALKHSLRIESMRYVGPQVIDHLPVLFESTIHNEGTAHETPQGHVVVENMFGQLVATVDLQERETPLRVLPGSARRFEMMWGDEGRECRAGFFSALRCEWSPMAFGVYRARLVLDGSTSAASSEDVRFFVVPWRTLGSILLIFGLLIAGWRLRTS